MDNQTMSSSSSSPPSSDTFSNKNMIIIILIVLLIITTLGVNVVNPLTNIIKSGINNIIIFIQNILGSVLHNTGEILNVSTEVVSDTAKTTIDLGAGAIVNAGNLLKGAGTETSSVSIDKVINKSSESPVDPNPTPSENSVQQSIQSGNKSSWCLVGNFAGKNSCVEVDTSIDKCMSDKIFPSKEKCLQLNN